jgi:hypothetical protein
LFTWLWWCCGYLEGLGGAAGVDEDLHSIR